jgi:hypothetical protein
MVHVVIELEGAQVSPVISDDIRPDVGHIHLYVDNLLVSMTDVLETDLSVGTGLYVLRAEFVASDHGPFSPRVFSKETFFRVR